MGLTRLVLICIYSLRFCYGVPQNYCFHRLNTSNCDVAPTPVFTYYHEGSRCEVEFWRGCPTVNKFADEIECSVSCIGDLRFEMFSSEENEIDNSPSNRCHENLNPPTCKGDKNITVFTYDSIAERCVQDTWTGCSTLNKFKTKAECDKECAEDLPLPEKLKIIDKKEAEDIINIIDEVDKGDTAPAANNESAEPDHTTKAGAESEEETTQTAGDADEVMVD